MTDYGTINITVTDGGVHTLRPKDGFVIDRLQKRDFFVKIECFGKLRLTMPDGTRRDITDWKGNSTLVLHLGQNGELQLLPGGPQ